MKSTICKNCGGEYGIHHYQTNQCPVGGYEAPIGRKQEYKASTFEPENDDAATIASQTKHIAELENLLAEAKAIIDAKNEKIMELKRNKGIDELHAALSNARIALTFYREWMLAQDENACTRYPFGIDAENAARELLKGG